MHGHRLAAQFKVQCAVLVEGKVDREALRGSLLRMIERHEVLRTTFSLQANEEFPVQVVREPGSLFLLEVDSREGNLEATLEQALRDEQRKDFDLENGPPARFILHRFADNRHILIITLPSLCADEFSLQNVFGEITRSYRGLLYREEITEQAPPYVQFADWQNRLLEDNDESDGKQFWVDVDPGDRGTATFPFESPSRGPFDPGSIRIDLTAEIDEQMNSTSTSRGFAIDVFLLTCWEALLSRLSGEPEIVVNMLSDGRIYEEMESALGLYAKWLPVRHKFSKRTRFSDALKDIDLSVRKASAWQEYFMPAQGRNHGRDDPSVDSNGPAIAFAYQVWADPQWVGGLRLSLVSEFACTDPFKLKLVCRQFDYHHRLEFHYDPCAYSTEAVEAISRRFVVLVKQALSETDAVVDDLDMTG